MRHLISWLSRFGGLRRLVRGLGLHTLGNWWLRRFPLVKRLPGSGVIYRATRLESIPLAVEMFDKGNLYDAALLPANFTSFADLGCNVGYFTCWLAHLARGRTLRGLMLDANPQAVEEASWHARANAMPEVYGIHGIAGEGKRGDFAEFYLYESNICSTSHLPDLQRLALPGRWERILVPCVSLEEHWRRRFGEARCHLLKIDIEGSEMNFLKAEQSFLTLCDSVLVEWHKWTVTLGELRQFLVAQGFAHVKTVEENDQMGTAFFKRA
ncbi:MAG TPA: FkbM family methyltransferase [Candidatus Binatia bacterium]|nr:FkbM family methyltransferase [Candidatus Binatia bacterium]